MSCENSNSFLPYKFNGEEYHAISDLVEALLRNPYKGINELKNGKLTQHFGYFDPVTEMLCLTAEKYICENENINYRVFFQLVYQLNPFEKRIFCGLNEYSDISELANECITESTTIVCKTHDLFGSNGSSEFISHLLLMLECDFLDDYVRKLNNDEIINCISKCNHVLHDGKLNYSPVQKALIFGYYLCSCRKVVIQGELFESPEEFYINMKSFQKKDNLNYSKYLHCIKNELEFYRNIFPDESSRISIQKIYDDLMTAIFGDYEYVFKNGEDFNLFIDKLIEDGKLYEVESLLSRYYLALQDVSREIWKNDAGIRLSNIVGKFIHFGEFIFKDKEDIKKFIDAIVINYKDNPLYLKRFVSAYKGVINMLENKDKDFLKIFSPVKKLNLELEVIELDEYLFTSEGEFVEFLNKLELEHPLKIRDFVNLHRNALLKLSMSGHTKSLIDKIMMISASNTPSSSIFLDNRTFYSFPVTGQYIKFGNYWQDNSCDKKPIEWFVSHTHDNNVELISKFGLDFIEGSELSKWFNGFFLTEAFSESERKMIVSISVPRWAKGTYPLICNPTPYAEALANKERYGHYWYFSDMSPHKDYYDSQNDDMYLDMIDERGFKCGGLFHGKGIVRPLIIISIGPKKTR